MLAPPQSLVRVAQLEAGRGQLGGVLAFAKVPSVPGEVRQAWDFHYVHLGFVNVLLGQRPRALFRGVGRLPRDREFHTEGLSRVGISAATGAIQAGPFSRGKSPHHLPRTQKPR